MLPNDTTINELVDSVTTTYDHSGAVIYIIIVLLWYSIGIIFMLAMQMRARSETIEDSARRRTKLLIRNLRDHTNTKEILEELVDKKKRARLWDIYLGTTSETKDKLTRADTIRIRHIEKQLATMNRHRQLTNDTLFSAPNDIRYHRSRSDSRQAADSFVPVGSHLRRRSSFDQQTLERWKALANQSKAHEQIPWTTRKAMIRGYFRRHPKKPTASPSPGNIISFTSEPEETPGRQNPYVTYFHVPGARASVLNSEFFPVPLDPFVEEK